MLITAQNLPMKNNGGLPWGTIILAVIVIGGIGYFGYQTLQKPKTISKPKTQEDELESDYGG